MVEYLLSRGADVNAQDRCELLFVQATMMRMRMRIESISVMGIRLLLCVEAAVLGFGEWGESGVVMCWLLSEGRDVTHVLLQGWTGSHSYCS
jgi:hypothetical protein